MVVLTESVTAGNTAGKRGFNVIYWQRKTTHRTTAHSRSYQYSLSNKLTRANAHSRPISKCVERSLSNELTRATAHSRPKKRSLSNKLTQQIQLLPPETYRSVGLIKQFCKKQLVTKDHRNIGWINRRIGFTTAKLAATINVFTTKHTTPRLLQLVPR